MHLLPFHHLISTKISPKHLFPLSRYVQSLRRRMCSLIVEPQHSGRLIEFLVKHNTLAVSHQNQAATSGTFPGIPPSWVSWARRRQSSWKDIIYLYQSNDLSQKPNELPPDLVAFIQDCLSAPLLRKPFFVPEQSTPPDRIHGVNPKKIHEVFTMTSYVSSIFGSNQPKPRIVDIGAGQGYLSRALSAAPQGFHVLALDSDDNQTSGSMSRNDWLTGPSDAGEEGAGSVTHKTIRIGDVASLSNSIDEWISSTTQPDSILPVPVVLVGLHCCGELTPSILRFIRHSLHNSHHNYEIVGCVVVGCCYNMCEPTTFPLSRKVGAELKVHGPLSLHTQHLHLATQSPQTWSLTLPPALNSRFAPIADPASLSIRKVTYRALLSRRLPTSIRAEKDAPMHNLADVDWRINRVGRLGNTAYVNFPTFLRTARQKLGLQEVPDGADLSSDLTEEERELSRALEMYYVLRCLLGPAVESLIALDRYAFLQETVSSMKDQGGAEGGHSTVELVNLFDQFTGSLRNLALVWNKR